MLSQENRVHSRQQIAVSRCLYNIAPSADAKSFLHYVGRSLLSRKDYLGFRSNAADLSSGFDSVQRWESDVQENQIRLQFFRKPNRFWSV